ncbi:SCO4225 family membrane protein [Streptomyces sp. NPDC058157]|uniref:SCO4225 family membrane protein n=1 Tax=Streptomyces sp. NPDC058157 TaxID=3346360 RepID=UPI0036EE80AB
MGRRRSRLQVWLPAGYLTVVAGLLVWVEVLARTGDAGFAGIWPILATAPLSLPALQLFLPGPASPPAPEVAPPDGTGAVPPPPDAWFGGGFHGVLLGCALVNAAALWVLARGLAGLLARRRR